MPVRKYRVKVSFDDGGWIANITVRATTPWEAIERAASGLPLPSLKVIASMEVEEVP
jgi:hypothetical protein